MLNIVNFVPKVQALDKSAATLAEIRRQLGAVRVISVISLAETNRIDSIDPLIDLLAKVSDRTVFSGASDIHKTALKRLENTGQSAALVDEEGLLLEIKVFYAEHPMRTLLMAPVGKGVGRVGDILCKWAAKDRVPVLGYFKSLHDQGMGLSTLLSPTVRARSGLISRLHKLLRRLRNNQSTAKPGELPVSLVDWLMVFNQRHAKTVADKAGKTQLIETGYQLLFPAWRELVRQSTYCRSYPHDVRFEVVLFTRGETPGRPPEDNIVPHANLEKLFRDIVASLDDTGRDWHLRIKPHPIQDVDVLSRLIAGRDNIEIVYEAPALLAATADLAIATYSSTVVDTLALGVPTIEYFFETPFFQAKHPAGSPFPGLGAVKARNSAEFVKGLDDAISKSNVNQICLESLALSPDFKFLTNPNNSIAQEKI